MYISDFNYFKPASVEDACRILEENADAVPIAGGTDLLVEMKQGVCHHNVIVSLAGIEELKHISKKDNTLEIGAAVTHNEIAQSLVAADFCGAICDAASKIGTDQIRNTGTIGGNLCTGASCCDSAPVLMALNAQIEIAYNGGARRIPVRDFFIFHKETRIKKSEIMTKILITIPKPGTRVCFEKFGLREAASLSVASAAAAITVENDVCTEACVVIGAVAPTPMISPNANDLLIGSSLKNLKDDKWLLENAGEAAVKDSQPIDDIRSSKDYRRDLVKILVKRAVHGAVNR